MPFVEDKSLTHRDMSELPLVGGGPIKSSADLNGKTVRDQTIRVLPSAKSETSRTNLYIEGLPANWNDHELSENYKQFGEVTQVKILTDKQTGQRTGVAFVHFSTADAA